MFLTTTEVRVLALCVGLFTGVVVTVFLDFYVITQAHRKGPRCR